MTARIIHTTGTIATLIIIIPPLSDCITVPLYHLVQILAWRSPYAYPTTWRIMRTYRYNSMRLYVSALCTSVHACVYPAQHYTTTNPPYVHQSTLMSTKHTHYMHILSYYVHLNDHHANIMRTWHDYSRHNQQTPNITCIMNDSVRHNCRRVDYNTMHTCAW